MRSVALLTCSKGCMAATTKVRPNRPHRRYNKSANIHTIWWITLGSKCVRHPSITRSLLTSPGVEVPKEIESNINLGICLSMPGSRFFAKYQEAQKVYHDHLWLYNSGRKPTRIYERFPGLAYLSPKLNVMCAGDNVVQAGLELNKKLAVCPQTLICGSIKLTLFMSSGQQSMSCLIPKQ